MQQCAVISRLRMSSDSSLGLTPALSFVIPCLNEAETIASVVEDCHQGAKNLGIPYEIIVADNGSNDGSQLLAERMGAQVINVTSRGYGSALKSGIAAARGSYVMMGDADSTYDFRQARVFVEKLRLGNDLVLGNRFQGGISPGAMPFLHQYLGNPVISLLGRMFFGIKVGDIYCGLRAFSRDAVLSLNLTSSGMEYATEMVIKSSLIDLAMAEVPTTLRPDPPGRSPHLRTWRDGWRTLKYMLSFAPKYSFLPLCGLLLFIGILLTACYALQVVPFTGTNTLVFAACCVVAAFNLASDYLLTREMLYSHFNYRKSKVSRWLERLTGLHTGTDRLFKLAAIAFILSILNFLILTVFAWRQLLFLPVAGIVGLSACTLLLLSVSAYLTASKITSYRTLHHDMLKSTKAFQRKLNSRG